jgi:hypothetical protein
LARHLQGTPRRFSSDARGPSVSFAPGVSVACKASSVVSRPAPEVLPALGIAPSLPDKSPAPSATMVKARPPAEPPPPAFLPLMDLSLLPSPVTPAGLFMHMLLHDGPVSPSSPFNHLNVGQDGTAPALLPDSFLVPPSFGGVHHVVTFPRVLGFQGDVRSYACINLTAMATLASPGHLIDGPSD